MVAVRKRVPYFLAISMILSYFDTVKLDHLSSVCFYENLESV